MKDNKTKIITIAALVVAVIALSIGFAAFASTLNISTSASVTPTNTFSVKFASSVTGTNGEFTEFQVTPEVAVTSSTNNGAISGTPEIDNTNNPTIGNLSASFTQPGQSVTYTFYVVNDGNYDAYLTNLVFNNATGSNSFKDCVSDSLSSNPATQSLVDNVCSNITFNISIGNDSNITSSTTLNNHLLLKSHYELVTVVIAYTGSQYADGAFKVNFGDIDLNYRTIDEPELVATQDTPVEPEQVVADNLIPTAEQLEDALLLESDLYSFDDESNLMYFSRQEFPVVLLYYNDVEYVWFLDADVIVGSGYEKPFTWYYKDTKQELSEPLSISLSDFVNPKNDNGYVSRVIASLNN